ncbi:hypothetical protein LSH36_301g01026 [Paralvinella palmiformis]|uniref:Uncharacterized protein n=1 Tax=Paralvinella palmiformis TaxID=53620 RepID=A0AAD9JHP4_9ANNE|nr:hypothetical protein LSH36_301g01026 [Paralvinella palmiformis]
MKEGGVVVDSHHGSDWIVPRRVMCAFFWVGIVLLFTGIILLVTSKHKEEFYQSWGAILLGLGFCLLLICFILCLHAYCVITVSDDEVPNARRQPQTQTTIGPVSVRQRAPLKEPPNFKIPSTEVEGDQSTARGRQNFHPARLKPISENGSPNLTSNTYGATTVRADHIRPCASRTASLPPSGKNTTPPRDNKSVHYSARRPSVTISLKNESPNNSSSNSNNNDAESGYQNSTGTPKNNNSGSTSLSLNGDEESEKNALSSRSSSSLHSIDGGNSPGQPHAGQVVPMPIIRDKNNKKPSPQASATNSSLESLSPPVVCSSGKREQDPLGQLRSLSIPTSRSLFETDQNDEKTEYARQRASSERRDSGRYGCFSAVDEETIAPEYQPPTRPPGARLQGIVTTCSRPVASARVTQLSINRQPKLPNGAPLQLTYSRQYPISSVHAYPTHRRKHNLYTPLRVQIDPPDDDLTRSAATFRPMPAISETRSVDHRMPMEDWQGMAAGDDDGGDDDDDDDIHRPPSREIIRPFDRTPSNLLGVQSSNLIERGLNNSANVYLSADDEFSESKMSIYDNLNYIRI